jgi:3-dehydroquinate synthase
MLRVKMVINSKIKKYSLTFKKEYLFSDKIDGDFFIIDRNVYNLHRERFKQINITKILIIDALEKNKTYLKCLDYITELVNMGIKRGNVICAIGGGIIQDITGFISSILFRGVPWNFYPTTLLSQCDSCIGGKTSINLGKFKNIVGNFNPPDKITIDMSFLSTLKNKEIQSGIGEILKVAIIDNKERINYNSIIDSIESNTINETLIRQSLEIKKEIIEIDEFDKDLRNIMNYGHTFGHAIESISNFKIPHGIAVGIGINIANNIAKELYNIEITSIDKLINKFLNTNSYYVDIFKATYSEPEYMSALKRDKKNTRADSLKCILLNYQKVAVKVDISFIKFIKIFKRIIKEEKW